MKVIVEAAFTLFALLGIVQSSLASCDGHSTKLYADAGTSNILTSPSYPGNYNSSLKCSWKIESHYNSLIVKLKIVSFDTTGTSGACTSETDNLEVFDQGNLVGRYCGSNVPGNLTIYSTRNLQDQYLTLIFTSPSNKTKQGFKLEYMAVQDSYCGSFLLDAELDKPKILTSPNYPANYPPQAKCSWLITAPPGHFVKLNFTSFDLGGFDKYYGKCRDKAHTLEVTDLNQSYPGMYMREFQLGRYCGSIVPANVISSKRYLTLVFSSRLKNNHPTKQGFRLEYFALSSPASYYSMCIGRRSSIMSSYVYTISSPVILKLNASSNYQYIRSPLYPEKYPSNLYCRWHITASSSSKRIKAEVTDLKISNKLVFYCESIYYSEHPYTDTLEIRGGDNSGRYCDLHNDTSRTVISSDQYMRIAFSTNSDNFFRGNTAGFELRFIEIPVGHTSILKFGIGIIILSQSLVQLI